jgi:putative SOS response-associated peptidase YedK
MAPRRKSKGSRLAPPKEQTAVCLCRALGYVRDVDGEVLYTFTIITTIPNALIRRIHNRMPVIFDRLQAKQWLDPRLSTRSADIAADFAPFPSEQMPAHDVSPLVNQPEYERADCIRPIRDPQSRLL